MTAIENALNAQALGPKPGDREVDFHGLTHPGKVREENQDHFLLSSLHKRMDVHLRLRSMTSAKHVCEDLLQDALDDGGSDNITILVARALRNDA